MAAQATSHAGHAGRDTQLCRPGAWRGAAAPTPRAPVAPGAGVWKPHGDTFCSATLGPRRCQWPALGLVSLIVYSYGNSNSL